jgi:hypothetical protein
MCCQIPFPFLGKRIKETEGMNGTNITSKTKSSKKADTPTYMHCSSDYTKIVAKK